MAADQPIDLVLDREVTLSARLDESGLAIGGKSRFLAAVDHLFGSVAALAAIPIDAARARRLIRKDADLAIEAAQQRVRVERVMVQLGADLAESVAPTAVKERRLLENKAAVVHGALEHLAEATDEDGRVEEADELDPDWLNYFEGHAEKATTERMRQLWAQVLAREVRAPGSCSLKAMRIVAETSRADAEFFQTVASARNDRVLPQPPVTEGDELLSWEALEAAGLVSTGLINEFKLDKKGDARIGFGSTTLHIEGSPNATISMSCAVLTKEGLEVAAMLPPPNPEAFALKAFDLIKNDLVAATLISIGRQAEITTVLRKKLKTRTTP